MDFPTRVTVENKAHPTYTLIQIQTPDRLGLLYELLTAFGEERVSIALSRISTEKGRGHRHLLCGRSRHARKNHRSIANHRVAGAVASSRAGRRPAGLERNSALTAVSLSA